MAGAVWKCRFKRQRSLIDGEGLPSRGEFGDKFVTTPTLTDTFPVKTKEKPLCENVARIMQLDG